MIKQILLLVFIIHTVISSTTTIHNILLARGVGAYVEKRCSDAYAMSIRTKIMSEASDGLNLDMGGYFWGPSIMTREQRLNLTSTAFVRSGYDAFALTANDLIADYQNTEERMASSFFQRVDSGPPIVTNLEQSSVINTTKYAVVEENNITFGILSLLDPTKLDLIPSSIDLTFQGYDQALTSEIERIRQDDRHDVDILMLMIDSIPISENTCSSETFSSWTYLESLVRSHVEIDLVFAGPNIVGNQEESVVTVTNWFDQAVFIVSLQDGDVIHHVNMTLFDENRTLSNVNVEFAEISCENDPDSIVQSTAVQTFNAMNEVARSTIVANLSQQLSEDQIGMILCDSIASLNVDFAMLLNESEILNGFSPGHITLENITTLFSQDSQIAVIELTGADIRSTVQDAVSPSMMYFSSNVSGSYHFRDGEVSLDSIRVNEFDLSDERVYKVGVLSTTSSSSFDSIILLGTSSSTQLAGSLERILDSDLDFTRLIRTEDVNTIHLGLLCGARGEAPNPAEHEECDHAKMMIDLLNNKTDGFLDNLLPYSRFNVTEYFVGCVNNNTIAGFESLMSQDPVAFLGPTCSTDVAEISQSSFREDRDFRGVIVSPSSTAPSIANDTAYPNVARLSTSENRIQIGLREIALEFGWQKVGIVRFFRSGKSENFTLEQSFSYTGS